MNANKRKLDFTAKLPPMTMTAFDCRCEKRFCIVHTYAENHNCTFDYKTFHRQNLVEKAGLGGGEIDKVGERV